MYKDPNLEYYTAYQVQIRSSIYGALVVTVGNAMGNVQRTRQRPRDCKPKQGAKQDIEQGVLHLRLVEKGKIEWNTSVQLGSPTASILSSIRTMGGSSTLKCMTMGPVKNGSNRTTPDRKGRSWNFQLFPFLFYFLILLSHSTIIITQKSRKSIRKIDKNKLFICVIYHLKSPAILL